VTPTSDTPFPVISSATDRNHSIITYLSRPQEIFNLNWFTSDPFEHELLTLNYPGDMSLPFILNKIEGFKYMRADMHVSIRVNKMPFHQGALILGIILLRRNKLPMNIINL
jgi:hypothetical protein